MKRKSFFWATIVFICGTLAVYLVAQQIVPTTAVGELEDAIALYNEGKPQEAKEALAAIGKGDPDYAVAQCYKALCLYALNDKKGFWKTMDPPEVRRALLPLEIKEDVWFKQIDAFLSCGKFDSLFRKIQAFQSDFQSSARSSAVEEYRLAGLFECGRKKSRDASRKDESQFDPLWNVAKTNLQEFLTLAAAFGGANYTVLPKRVLKEEVWVARLILGDENAALAEIPIEDVASREKFALLRLELYLDLRRDEVDENLQRLADFLKEFPEPGNRARVEVNTAVLKFRKGRQLCLEAEGVEKAGNTNGADAKRALAGQYFEAQRALQKIAVVDEDAGITADDILEMREDVLYSYFLEKNYTRLSALAASTIAESTPGDPNWILARVYDGIMLANQSPPKTSEAAKVLDEVLAVDFKDEHHHDRLVVLAAKWRVYLMLTAHDMAKASELAQWVQESQCRRDYKVAFSNAYSSFVTPPDYQPQPK